MSKQGCAQNGGISTDREEGRLWPPAATAQMEAGSYKRAGCVKGSVKMKNGHHTVALVRERQGTQSDKTKKAPDPRDTKFALGPRDNRKHVIGGPLGSFPWRTGQGLTATESGEAPHSCHTGSLKPKDCVKQARLPLTFILPGAQGPPHQSQATLILGL